MIAPVRFVLWILGIVGGVLALFFARRGPSLDDAMRDAKAREAAARLVAEADARRARGEAAARQDAAIEAARVEREAAGMQRPVDTFNEIAGRRKP